MVKPTKDEALGESYEIGTFVLNSLKRKTTAKMVLDLMNNYEEPIRNIIDETVLATIERFDLKTIPNLYEEIEKKANDLAKKNLDDWLTRENAAFHIVSSNSKNEYFDSKRRAHRDSMLKLHELEKTSGNK